MSNNVKLNRKLKAIIVEDEGTSRETLRNYLQKYCPDIDPVAEAENIKEGLAAINKYNPDVVFLDVEMPYGNAFDLLEQVTEINFETVFVTAYSNYAIQALNFSAAYYLLKPVDIGELVKAVEKIKESVSRNQQMIHTKVLIENLKIENKQLQKIVLPLIDGFQVIRVNEIIHCEAEDNFTRFYLTNGRKMLICRTLKFYESLLENYDFIRVHKSHLINFQCIQQYKKGKGGQVIMTDGMAVDVSPQRKDALMQKFNS
jgi:two-component system, LytTR family, response regulator